jgi:hypothetical protein
MEINQIIKIIVPEEILKYFELNDVKEKSQCYEFYLEEKEELVPSSLQGETVVLDGFCNPLSILSFPIKMKPVYLVIKRRRWKPKGGGTHYSNEYDFTHPHIKATKEFAAFLKEVHGHTPDQYLSLCRAYGDSDKDTSSLV